MSLAALGLCCPVCRNDLRETGDRQQELRCDHCPRSWPVVLGIPDLRVFADPYIDIEADRAKGLRLAERYADSDFAGLVAYYYSITDTVPAEQAHRFTAGLLAAPTRAAATLEAWQRLDGSAIATGSRLIELGCGTAPLMVYTRRALADVVGVDIAFRWLVVARKRLEEAGLEAPLVCACAEALPFRDASRDVVACESVLEVTREPVRAAQEACRVVRPGGRMFVTTPNRWSLGPDPHIGVMAGGWWPGSWLASYARRHGALPPERQLMSSGTLRALLEGAGFDRVRMALPDIAEAQRRGMSAPAATAAGLYQAVKDLPVLHDVLAAIGPLLLATARRPGMSRA